MSRPNILLCTVGTGNIDQLRETLLEPLKKSIRKGDWTRVILLPSQLTKENAGTLRDEVQDVPIEIKELAQAGAEDDADACFAHFDGILQELRAQGLPAETLLVDFTRGTKAMSAALVLAAVRHDLPKLRYISGGKRDQRGMVVPGTEIVAEVHTTIATARKRLDDAHRFFQHGNFAAAVGLLTGPGHEWPVDLQALAGCLTRWAKFYSAWDRLDYQAARAVALDSSLAVPAHWGRFAPTSAMRDWASRLAEPFPANSSERAGRLRFQVLDLLASAERRLRDHHFEDGILRAYRIVEMVGQLRLFTHGLDSAALPADHPAVCALQNKLTKKKSPLLTEVPGKPGLLIAARLQVARLLAELDDALARRLLDLDGNPFIAKRNKGVLIHGFESLGSTDADTLRDFLQVLEHLVLDDSRSAGFDAGANLQIARSCTFTP
jgi:CRISPR-associated protein (TIGR02710 family)